jgi:hypothetical protein
VALQIFDDLWRLADPPPEESQGESEARFGTCMVGTRILLNELLRKVRVGGGVCLCVCVCVSVCCCVQLKLSVSLSVCLSIYLSICLPVCLSLESASCHYIHVIACHYIHTHTHRSRPRRRRCTAASWTCASAGSRQSWRV